MTTKQSEWAANQIASSAKDRWRTRNDRVSYRMPAEWEPHGATWLSWPHNKTTWPGKLLERVETTYLLMMRALLPAEKVKLLVNDAQTGRRVLRLLESKKAHTSNLVLHQVKTVDAWIRDYGPIFVKGVIARRNEVTTKQSEWAANQIASVASGRPRNDGSVAFTKWIFNAWGGKYKDLARDNVVVNRIAAFKAHKRFDVPIVLEGGSIDVNGQGVCLTTEQCLLNPNRNPLLSKKQIEGYLKKYLGIARVIWLGEGIEGDDTDGHVDDITRFVNPRTILTAVEPDVTDPNHAVLEHNLDALKKSRFRIVELPMPGRVEDFVHGGRLPASYANFYIGNHAVLVPLYGHRNDQAALKIIRKVFPGRKIAGIECTALVHGLGSIHCVTQQEPI